MDLTVVSGRGWSYEPLLRWKGSGKGRTEVLGDLKEKYDVFEEVG